MIQTNESTLPALRPFTARAVKVIALIAAAVLIWYTSRVFMLAFGGILLAVFLDFLAGKIAGITKIRRGWAFAVVVISLAVLLALIGWEVFPRIADQVNDLIHKLPLGLERMRAYLNSRPWGQTLLQHLPGVLASANITAEISTVAEKAFEGLAGLVVIAVVGLYAGASPSLYERGLLHLFPTRRRDRAREVLGEVAYTLRWWILGQLVPMAVLAIVTWIGLWLIGVNLAFTLGIFTGVMVFIPYIGSLIAFAVTMIAVLIQGPAQIWPVVLLYVGIHAAEGYLLTPLIQKRAVYVPPALTILAQMLMGLLLGFLGFALATPLTAAAMVGVKMLYLHERPEHH